MELEAQVEALDKELKNEDHRFPINQSRKSDFLFTISLLLQNSQKSEISTVQAKLEAIFLQIASQGCSAPLSRLLKKCINLTLSTGNTNRAGDNLYEYLKQASSLKLSISARSTALRMIGNLYLEFGQKIPSPPTDDLIELSKRIYKTSDIPLKISNVKCLTDMSASRPNNLNGVSLQEFIKILIRYSAVIFI